VQNIAENFNPVGRAQHRYRQDDRQMSDGRPTCHNV